VAENLGIRAAALFEAVGQDGKTLRVEGPRWELGVLVRSSCKGQHGWAEPDWVKGDGAEGVAEVVAERLTLLELFLSVRRSSFLA
jgi:hypothetical protein